MTVDYDVVGGVAWMTINRPEARNALSRAVRQGLFDGFARFADDGDAADDAQEGPRAFREGRQPAWKGH